LQKNPSLYFLVLPDLACSPFLLLVHHPCLQKNLSLACSPFLLLVQWAVEDSTVAEEACSVSEPRNSTHHRHMTCFPLICRPCHPCQTFRRIAKSPTIRDVLYGSCVLVHPARRGCWVLLSRHLAIQRFVCSKVAVEVGKDTKHHRTAEAGTKHHHTAEAGTKRRPD